MGRDREPAMQAISQLIDSSTLTSKQNGLIEMGIDELTQYGAAVSPARAPISSPGKTRTKAGAARAAAFGGKTEGLKRTRAPSKAPCLRTAVAGWFEGGHCTHMDCGMRGGGMRVC